MRSAARVLPLVVLALTPFLGAAAAYPQSRRLDPRLEAWRSTLYGVEDHLRAGRWKPARLDADRIVMSMLSQIQSGPDSANWLARAVALRALAEAGLGNADAAAWDWNVALSLRPRVAALDLTPYGVAGEFFHGEEFRKRSTPTPDNAAGEDEPRVVTNQDPEKESASEITPPEKVRAPKPDYPLAKNLGCIQQLVLVSVAIDREGRTFSPRFAAGTDPVFAVAALETVRRWKFKPARRDGEPVVVDYVITMNFRAPRCAWAPLTGSPGPRSRGGG